MLNHKAPKYIKLTKVSGETYNTTPIVGGFNTPPSIMDKTSKQKVSKAIENLNNIMN